MIRDQFDLELVMKDELNQSILHAKKLQNPGTTLMIVLLIQVVNTGTFDWDVRKRDSHYHAHRVDEQKSLVHQNKQQPLETQRKILPRKHADIPGPRGMVQSVEHRMLSPVWGILASSCIATYAALNSGLR